MKLSLLKDTFREIWKSPSRFLSIFMIVALGTAFFAGIKAAAPDMKNTADHYYDNYNMMDVRVLSTMGLTDSDIEAMKQVEGVEKVQPSYFADVVTTVNLNEFVFRIHALPAEAMAAGSQDYMNKPKLVEGRMPQKSGECIIEYSNIIDIDLHVGDTFTVSSGKKEDLSKVLKTTTFTVVGKAVSSYYLTYDKDSTDIGSGKVNFFMMVLSSDFAYPVYTEALITVKGAKELNSYSKEYKKLVEKTTNQLDNIVAERSEIRLSEIQAMATDQLNQSKASLLASEADFETKIADGQKQLDDAKAQLLEGQATLETEKKNYEAQVASAQQQIADGESDLSAGQTEYNAAVIKYDAAKAQYGDLLAALDETTTALNQIVADSQAQIDSLTNRLVSDPNLSDQQRVDFNIQIYTYKANAASAKSALKELNNLNASAKSSMKDAQDQLDAAKAKLNAAQDKINKAKADLAAAQIDSQAKFAAAQRDIDEGTRVYNESKHDFDKKKADGEQQIEDGKEQVVRAENQIELLSKPSYYVLNRSQLYSYADYSLTADRMDSIAKIFPLFFLCVAVLVCLTTMTRMVDEQRGTIGTFKALGYTNIEIVYKYVNYAVLASALGGTIGVIVGINIFPKLIFNSWAMMYTLPPMEAVPQIPLMVLTVLAGIAVTTASAYSACSQELMTSPAFLMRPKAPKAGKDILLEKITFLWNRFSFSQKVTMRNIFRYKKRFFMTIIGIAGCSALLVAGLGLSNSIGQIVDKQYKEIFTYNMSMKYTPTVTDDEKTAVIEKLKQTPAVKALMTVTEMNAQIQSKGDEISLTLICPDDSTEFLNYVTLRNRTTQQKLTLPEKGLTINEKLAKELGVGIGDTVTLDNGDGAIKKMEVAAITENYIFHYGYISKEYYNEIFRLAPSYNCLLIKLNQTTDDVEDKLGSEMIALGQIASVSYYSDASAKFQETVKSLDAIVWAIIGCAGLLAFVVLYNLTNINLSERIREIATIKVLGFFNSEVAIYVYRENIILSMIGAAAGLVVGIYLHRIIMSSIEQTGIMFGDFISWKSFIIAFAATIAFTMLVNIVMYRRLTHIPMVESLKTIE